jgi:hypothetical protein
MDKFGAILVKGGTSFIVFLVSLTVFWTAIAFAAYRIPRLGERRVLEGDIYYNKIELELDSRSLFENLLGKTLVRVTGHPPLYMSPREQQQLWPEADNLTYTRHVLIAATPLFFGGYAAAEVISSGPIQRRQVRGIVLPD